MLADASFIGFIPVRDLAVARAFYEGTLGLRVVDDTPFALVLDVGGTMVRLTPVPEPAARPFTIAGWKVPAPISTSYGCRMTHPCRDQKLCSRKMRSWKLGAVAVIIDVIAVSQS